MTGLEDSLTSSHYFDSETGLYYLKSRYYDPETCRFINEDSQLNTVDGVLGFNLFSYCMNNPVNMSDQSGHMSKLFKKIIDTVQIYLKKFE